MVGMARTEPVLLIPRRGLPVVELDWGVPAAEGVLLPLCVLCLVVERDVLLAVVARDCEAQHMCVAAAARLESVGDACAQLVSALAVWRTPPPTRFWF